MTWQSSESFFNAQYYFLVILADWQNIFYYTTDFYPLKYSISVLNKNGKFLFVANNKILINLISAFYVKKTVL